MSEHQDLADLFHSLSPDAQAAALVYGVVDPHVRTTWQGRADTAPRRHSIPGRTPGGYTTPGRDPGAREARAGVRPEAGRGSEGVAALGAVADDGGPPHRHAGQDRGWSRPRASPPLVLRRRRPDRDGAALQYRRRPPQPCRRRQGSPGGVGVPGRARRRRPAPHPARVLPGPRPLGLPDARHQTPPRRPSPSSTPAASSRRIRRRSAADGSRSSASSRAVSTTGGRGLRRPAPEGASRASM